MMSESVSTYKHLLEALQVLKPKYRTALLKACDDDEINIICECIYNVLKGKIPLEKEEKLKLNKHKNILRKLVSKGKQKLRKTIIIQKGGAFLPLILGAVLSALFNSIT